MGRLKIELATSMRLTIKSLRLTALAHHDDLGGNSDERNHGGAAVERT